MKENMTVSDPWMQTYSGRVVHPLTPDPDEIYIEDIIHCLSYICRYAGHSFSFYSVAEHSMIMSRMFPEHAGIALFHDAAEAYFGDLPKPIKMMIPDFKYHEHRLLSVIFEKFGLPDLEECLPIIHTMDMTMLDLERTSLSVMSNRMDWNIPDEYKYDGDEVIAAMPPDDAEFFFNQYIRIFLKKLDNK